MKILVIGDSCQDIHIYGVSKRLCPDAPVPVLVSLEERVTGGMAANVANNLLALGAECQLITQHSVITKTRFVDKKTNHMFIRVDNEEEIDRFNDWDLLKYDVDAVVISDYNKGFLYESDIEKIASIFSATNIPVFLDTKKKLGSWAKEIDFIKINEYEYEMSEDFLQKNANLFRHKLIITRDNKGAEYLGKNFPVKDVPMKDKSGAGDTFLAGFVFQLLKLSLLHVSEAIEFANKCATQVIQKKGVNVVNLKELNWIFNEN